MEIFRNFINDFKYNYSTNDRLITILAFSLFFHYIITALVIFIIALYAIIKCDLKNIMKKMMSAWSLLAFSGYLLITSLFYQNWLGALISVGMFFVFVVVIYYRQYIHKKLFESIINIMIVMSLVCVIIAFFEQAYYVITVENLVNFFDISNKPEFRVRTFFFNANYYAMMILFAESFCVYKIIDSKKNRELYTIAALLNIIALYLTGSRIVWLGLFLTWFVMFVVSKKKPAIIATIAFGVTTVAASILKLPLIPRLIEYGISLGRRATIYKAAFIMMKDTWLFGRGPLTYYYLNHNYLDDYIAKYGSADLNKYGIQSQHVHSMFLEPFISFGVVGSITFIIYMFAQFRRIWHLYKSKLNHSLVTLIVGAVVAMLSSNTIDFSIFWVQTGTLFLIILGSSDIYRDKIVEPNKFKRKKNS